MELELEKLDITDIAESIIWLEKAVENRGSTTEGDYKAYFDSYVAHEFLTFS